MRRIAFVYVLIAAVLVAAAGLAYYGYSYSIRIADEVRAAHLATRAELAREKVVNIQYAIESDDQAVYDSVNLNNWDELKGQLDRSMHSSVFVFDEAINIIPGSRKSKRGDRDWEKFEALFEAKIKPDLELSKTRVNQRRHHHAVYEGRPYLISYTRLRLNERLVYVVLEVDMAYLVGSVIPKFLDIKGPNLYQLVDHEGQLRFGYSLEGIPREEVVEFGFPSTLSLWKLRVAPRNGGQWASRDNRRETIDLAIIGLAMSVIVAGLAVTVWAVRRERRLSLLKSDFISNVSHELKTPLSLISMFGELLSMGRARTPEQAQEYAEIIHRESVRLSRLIDNVLDFAKIERGADVYEFSSSVHVGQVVNRTLEICRQRAERADMTVDINIQDDLPTVRLDENAITLAILNLVDNAIKYAAVGKRIEINVVNYESKGVAIIVRDFGPGIVSEEQSNVFERFYRSRRVRLKPIRGSGIGLALVKHIALAHDGGVEVLSEVTDGCAIRLWIPAEGG